MPRRAAGRRAGPARGPAYERQNEDASRAPWDSGERIAARRITFGGARLALGTPGLAVQWVPNRPRSSGHSSLEVGARKDAFLQRDGAHRGASAPVGQHEPANTRAAGLTGRRVDGWQSDPG